MKEDPTIDTVFFICHWDPALTEEKKTHEQGN